MKFPQFKFTPLAVTTNCPVVAPVGTGTVIWEAVQAVAVAAVPLNVIVPEVPRFAPLIVTGTPIAPNVGAVVDTEGVGFSVNDFPLLANPPTDTTTFPVVADAGTVAAMEVFVQLVIPVATVPLNVTLLPPCAPANPVPLMVTLAPTAPELGDTLEIVGVTVKAAPLLLTPLANTTMFPVVAPEGTFTTIDVAPHVVIVAVVPLNLTVPDP
jgi:hypothetical protein